MIGASHGFEIPFVFGHYDLGPRANVVWTEENRAGRDRLSEQMMSYWTEFARSGRPGKGREGDQTEWGRWELALAAPKLMLLDTPAGGGLRMFSEVATPADVIERVRTDPRLESTRCDVARRSSDSLEGIGTPPISIEGCGAPHVAALAIQWRISARERSSARIGSTGSNTECRCSRSAARGSSWHGHR
jgi:hypothetical protein